MIMHAGCRQERCLATVANTTWWKIGNLVGDLECITLDIV
jgi:hypothetical protein